MNADQACVTWWDERVLPHLIGSSRAAQSQSGNLPNDFVSPLAEAIGRFSNAYVQRDHRSTLADPVRNEADAVAYATYFGAINFTKFDLLINQIPELGRKPLSVLDFGCGPGTGSLAAVRKLPTLSSIMLIDRSPPMLSLAERLIRGSLDTRQVQITRGSDLTSSSTSFDLILAGNVLCELPSMQRLDQARLMLDLLRPGGYLVLLEPGQPEPTRALMELKDTLFDRFPEATPVFPCTHRSRCPMLESSGTDWCHTELGWERPTLVTQLDEALGFNKHRLKFSALILRKEGSAIMTEEFRIIAPPQRNPRGVVLSVCGPGFFGPVLIGKSAAAECRVRARRARWFDRVTIEPKPSQSFQQVKELLPGL